MLQHTQVGPVLFPSGPQDEATVSFDDEATEVSLRPPSGVWDYTTSVVTVRERRRGRGRGRARSTRALRRTVRQQRAAILMLAGALAGVVISVGLVALDVAAHPQAGPAAAIPSPPPASAGPIPEPPTGADPESARGLARETAPADRPTDTVEARPEEPDTRTHRAGSRGERPGSGRGRASRIPGRLERLAPVEDPGF